jgi:hypothetical protein
MAACLLLAIGSAGCVSRRGIDFGHWARSPERIAVVRIVHDDTATAITNRDTILVLPPVGAMDESIRTAFHRELFQQAQNAFPAAVLDLQMSPAWNAVLSDENMTADGRLLNYAEIARLGSLLGVSHVLCLRVRDYRPYQPQVLSVWAAVVDTRTKRAAVELSGCFDASEQQVVVAVGDYLQARQARKFDQQNLDILLASPTEYRAFVLAHCCRDLADSLTPGRGRWPLGSRLRPSEPRSMERGNDDVCTH